MTSKSQQPGPRNDALFDTAIHALNLSKADCGVSLAQVTFGRASTLLAEIRSFTINRRDHVELGLACVDLCKALDRGLNGKRSDELTQPVRGAINKLTTTLVTIQRDIAKQGRRNTISRLLHAKTDKDIISAWRHELDKILRIFNDLFTDDHSTRLNLGKNALAGQEGISDRHQSVRARVHLGEGLPPPPKGFFGRAESMENIIGLVEDLQPIALIGAGGIGKTSIALAVVHDNRIKDRFGDNRHFIRCDEFPASRAHLLSRLSKIIGAGIEHPEDLARLRSFLSSKEMILFLDNAEPIFDPQGIDSQALYSMVEELSRFSNICLVITSRIATVPPHFKRPAIPALSMDSACDIFYNIYSHNGSSNVIRGLVRELDFHALSITLLATTAFHNGWDYDQLAKEWRAHHTRLLHTSHNESLATSIEFSLASPTFQTLDPNARDLLEVVAFFPQGVDEENLDWLLPIIPDGKNIFEKFCALSLAYRNNSFITMLAPIRDHFFPRHPESSPLLRAAKDHYFTRLSVFLDPEKPGFREARWIASEDLNVEHLLDIFISIDANADYIWDICVHFMRHLYWHKPRKTVLGPRIEGLPDGHRSKPKCLFQLARLFQSVGDRAEEKRLLMGTLKLEREWGDDNRIAQTLRYLSDVNRVLGLHEEGVRQAKEALEIYERLDDTAGKAVCWNNLAWSFLGDEQLIAAEGAALHAINLIPENGQEFLACESHRALGHIYRSKRKKERAIHHFETALGIASAFNWQSQLFWIHYSLAALFLDAYGFEDANAHIEQAKSHAGKDIYHLGRAMEVQSRIWCRQGSLGNAAAEVLRAVEIFQKLGAAKDVGDCVELLQKIDRGTNSWSNHLQRVRYAALHRCGCL